MKIDGAKSTGIIGSIAQGAYDVAAGVGDAALSLLHMPDDIAGYVAGRDRFIGERRGWSHVGDYASGADTPLLRAIDATNALFYGGIDLCTGHLAHQIINRGLGLNFRYFSPPPKDLRALSSEMSMVALIAAGAGMKGRAAKAPAIEPKAIAADTAPRTAAAKAKQPLWVSPKKAWDVPPEVELKMKEAYDPWFDSKDPKDLSRAIEESTKTLLHWRVEAIEDASLRAQMHSRIETLFDHSEIGGYKFSTMEELKAATEAAKRDAAPKIVTVFLKYAAKNFENPHYGGFKIGQMPYKGTEIVFNEVAINPGLYEWQVGTPLNRLNLANVIAHEVSHVVNETGAGGRLPLSAIEMGENLASKKINPLHQPITAGMCLWGERGAIGGSYELMSRIPKEAHEWIALQSAEIIGTSPANLKKWSYGLTIRGMREIYDGPEYSNRYHALDIFHNINAVDGTSKAAYISSEMGRYGYGLSFAMDASGISIAYALKWGAIYWGFSYLYDAEVKLIKMADRQKAAGDNTR